MAQSLPALLRPPQDDEELWYLVKAIWGVRIPRAKVCDDHVAPFTAFADAYFARSPVAVWKASRGLGGKTFTLALLSLTEAVTLGTHVVILGGSGAQSVRVHESIDQLWTYTGSPSYLMAKDPTRYETKLTNGGRITALLASQRSVRGPHPTRLRMDEVDEMNIEILDAALGQPMEKNGVSTQVVLSSTHQYPDGTMTKMLRRANERGWQFHQWCYAETSSPHGWLSVDEIERKKGMVTESVWATEFVGQEPNPEGRAIAPEAIERMFTKDLGIVKGEPGRYFQFEDPVAEGRYATGADWAKESDSTVIVTLRYDVEPARVVAFQRMHRQPWPKMVKALDDRLARYPGGAAHDATGSGNVVADLLQHNAEDYILVGRKRDDLLANYTGAVEQDRIVSPLIEYMHNEHKFATNDDLYGSGHLPDSVCAMALAWRAKGMRHRMRAYVLG